MFSTRQNKMARLYQKELVDIFSKEDIGIPHGILVTITVVRVTPDMGQARVYLSIFPSSQAADILKTINLMAKNIRYHLGCRIRNQVKEVPEINFFIDDSLDYLDRIEKLLHS